MRTVFLAAAVLTVVGAARAQDPKPDPEREKQEAKRRKEEQERWGRYLEKYPTEVPDVVGDTTKSFEPPKVEVGKDDGPVARAAKRAIEAERQTLRLIEQRIQAGQFNGGAAYVQMTAAASGMYASARAVWDDPEKLLPFAEYELSLLAGAELFNTPRVEQGVEEPQLLPQLRAARLRAEVDVLRLRERVKKK